MSLYRITHTYSPDHKHKVISSDMCYIDIWNTIVLLQCICFDIDSSHELNEANTVTFLTRYCDAVLHEPKSYCDTWGTTDALGAKEIDLHENWKFGFMNANMEPIHKTSIKEYEKKYNFYQQGMYSYLLEMMEREQLWK